LGDSPQSPAGIECLFNQWLSQVHARPAAWKEAAEFCDWLAAVTSNCHQWTATCLKIHLFPAVSEERLEGQLGQVSNTILGLRCNLCWIPCIVPSTDWINV